MTSQRPLRVMCLTLLMVVWYHSQPTLSSSTCSSKSTPWQPGWTDDQRNDLRCESDHCEVDEELDTCCPCRSCTTWEGDEIDLFIEYVSVLGKSVVITSEIFNESAVYKVSSIHNSGEMTEIPSNICGWDNASHILTHYASTYLAMNDFWKKIVEIDFSGNKIRQIPDINCLARLDKLYLNDNSITHVSNTSFTSLSRLRFIRLQGNEIKTMDPNILTAPQLHVFKADFNRNAMETLDVSNMMCLQPFCHINYNENKITTFVNELSMSIDMSKPAGPGFVSYQFNKITEFPDFKNLLNLDSIEQLGKFFNFGFDFTNIPLVCDCNIQPFLSKARHLAGLYWQSYMNITCANPPAMKGKPVITIADDDLVCTDVPSCPVPECRCVDKPSDDTLYINCSSSGLKSLPNIPKSNMSKYVSLDVSGNKITNIINATYLSRLTSLDISNNDLTEISDDVVEILEDTCKFLDISGNPKLRTLPQRFQYRDVCHTRMKDLTIVCNCNTLWIETWLYKTNCTQNIFSCKVPDKGVIQATHFHKDDLDCFVDFPFLVVTAVIATFIVTVALCVYMATIFKYELLIIYLRIRRKRKNVVLPGYKHDVFISCNENEEQVSRWVAKHLNPYLMARGYKTFFPLKDLNYGAERNNDIVSAIENSGNFLIILSENYLHEADEGMRSWTENEWKFGWNNFRQDCGKNIVLVNYDHMEPSDVDHPVIKAYVRVGCTVDFTNHDRHIMDEIETKLGKPHLLNDIVTKGNDNMNKKFTQFDLFVTSSYQDNDNVFELELKEKINQDNRNVDGTHEQLKQRKYQHDPKLCKYRQ